MKGHSGALQKRYHASRDPKGGGGGVERVGLLVQVLRYVNHSYTKCDMVYRVFFLSPRAAFVLVLCFDWPVLMNLVLALRHSLSENKKALVA